MSVHPEPHPYAGETVTLQSGEFAGQDYRVEDWWDRVSGQSWMDCTGNPACLDYAMRGVAEGDPLFSDEVVYGKVGFLGKLVHVRHLPELAVPA